MTSATIREEREEQQTQYYTLLLEEMYFKSQLIHEGSFEKSFCSFVVCCSLVVPKHGILSSQYIPVRAEQWNIWSKRVLRTLLNIYDGMFVPKRLTALRGFQSWCTFVKNILSQKFDRSLNTPLEPVSYTAQVKNLIIFPVFHVQEQPFPADVL